MPIKTLSDIRRLPRLGKISLGILKKRENPDGSITQYPEETDYFVLPPCEKNPDDPCGECPPCDLRRVYGENPKELRIIIPVENEEKFFSQYYRRYGFSGKRCIGDGEKARCIITRCLNCKEIWKDRDEKCPKCGNKKCESNIQDISCPCEQLEKKACRALAFFQVAIPNVKGSGVWQITTSSRNSIIDINSGIEYIRAICGRIRMIPLVLKREKTETQRMENGKIKKGTHYTLKLQFNEASLQQLQEIGQIAPERVLLPPPDECRDELFYPKNGFKPEEEAVEVEPEKPKRKIQP